MNGGPELTSLVRERIKEGWPEKKIRRWLIEEHQLYTKEQIDRVFKVINAEQAGEMKKANKRSERIGFELRRRKAALITLISLLIIILFAISPFPGAISSYLFGKHAGSCGFLEEKYCGLFLSSAGSDGQKYAAFNVPAGTPVFAPFTGVFQYKGENYQATGAYTVGYVVESSKQGTSTFEFYANFQPIPGDRSLVKKGAPVAIVRGGAVDQVLNSDFLVKG
ncbi:MAG: hypothetical protein KGL39_28650 [Patescibacteria group bacterium]|nr:hypothetical protein [Patescibacteria group bacterium]